MKTLYLLRHANAIHNPEDEKRPLSQQGQQEAFAISQYISQNTIIPDIILCSSAIRAQETCQIITQNIKPLPPVTKSDDLYLAPPSIILQMIQNLPDQAENAMIVGHNPGFYLLAGELCSGHDLRLIDDIFSTAALATLNCNVDIWSEMDKECCSLRNYTAVNDILL